MNGKSHSTSQESISAKVDSTMDCSVPCILYGQSIVEDTPLHPGRFDLVIFDLNTELLTKHCNQEVVNYGQCFVLAI